MWVRGVVTVVKYSVDLGDVQVSERRDGVWLGGAGRWKLGTRIWWKRDGGRGRS